MGRRSAYAVWSGALLAAVALVGGCTSTPEPTPTTSSPAATTPAPSSTTPSPTASSASPNASGIPAAAKVKSEAGAIAFANYFLERVNDAWMTPEASTIKSLSGPNCGACRGFAETATQLQAKGQRYASPVVRPGKVRDSLLDELGAVVTMEISQLKSSVVDESGVVISTDQAKSLVKRFQLGWKEGAWVLEELSNPL